MITTRQIEDLFTNNNIKLLLFYGGASDFDMLVGIFDYYQIISRKQIGKSNYIFNDSRLIFKDEKNNSKIDVPLGKLFKNINTQKEDRQKSFSLEELDAVYVSGEEKRGLNYNIEILNQIDLNDNKKTMK